MMQKDRAQERASSYVRIKRGGPQSLFLVGCGLVQPTLTLRRPVVEGDTRKQDECRLSWSGSGSGSGSRRI